MDFRRNPLSSVLGHIRLGISNLVRDRHFNNRLQFGSALGLGVALLLSFSLFVQVFGVAPYRLSDFLYTPQPPSTQVVLIAIDDRSVKELGQVPWQRSTIAALVDTITQGQPRAIGLDLTLVEPTSEDSRLATSLQRVPNLIQPIIGVDSARFPAKPNLLPNFGFALAPPAIFQTAQTRLGHTLVIEDPDDVVRRIPVSIHANERYYSAFGIALLEQSANTLTPRIENGAVELGTMRLPVDAEGEIQLNFFDTQAQTISASDVLKHRVPPSQWQNKFVLIGITGASANERFATPINPAHSTSSIEIQAHLMETILTQHFLAEQDRLTQMVMVFLMALLAGATLPNVRFLPSVGLTIIYYLLYLGYAFAEFSQGIVVQPIYPILALSLMLIGTAIFRYFSEDRHRTFIHTLLRRYVAPDAVEQVSHQFDQQALPLEGIRRHVSVIALDLSELEPLSGSMTAQAMIELLDQYVSIIVATIFQHDGSIVKHTGSAILAAWNLLTPQPNHAVQAVRTALEIRQELNEFSRKQPKELTIKIGMGVATGHVIAGRIGASTRAEYTIIGEIVGMAERIALKPERGVFIDVTTKELVEDIFDLREVKPVRLRRKTDPSMVWQLIETTGEEEQPLEPSAPTASVN